MAYLNRQIEEIQNSFGLRIYGSLLFLSYILTSVYWLRYFKLVLSPSTNEICWPGLDSCKQIHVFSSGQMAFIFLSYAALALLGIFLILRCKRVSYAFYLMLILECFHVSIVLSDYRFRMNQHYMSFFTILTFLFVPKKQRALTFLLPFFYFCAGTLKLNPEWISGAALYAPIWIFKGGYLKYATSYVIFLECLFIWGLWSSRRWIYYSTLAQLLLFHLWSFPVVGFYYPLLMLCLLSVFLIGSERFRWNSDFRSTINSTAAVIPLLLCMLHFYSHFLPGNRALTGEMRPLTLHMFDALPECIAELNEKSSIATERRSISLITDLVPRIKCDPIVFFNRTRQLCKELGNQKGGLDLFVQSKLRSEKQWHVIVDIKNVCERPPRYSYLGFNNWIY